MTYKLQLRFQARFTLHIKSDFHDELRAPGNFIIYANFSLSSFLNGSSKQAFVGEERLRDKPKRMSAWEAMINEVWSSVVCEGKMQIGLQVVFVSLKPTEVSETETEMQTTKLNPFFTVWRDSVSALYPNYHTNVSYSLEFGLCIPCERAKL